LGGVEFEAGPHVDVWRAPTDNDEPAFGAVWRAHGLDRLTHRTTSVRQDMRGLVVRTRIAAATTDEALHATYTWTAEGDGLLLTVELAPDKRWQFPLPRAGVRFVLPALSDHVEWFGRGPGEAYPDSRLAARVGHFTASVAELQTPYVRPQENGNRYETRWASIAGLRLEGRPHFDFTVRPWSPEALTVATHTHDLVPDPTRLWVNADLIHLGLGTASCGPGVLAAYRLEPDPLTFTLSFRPG
jgi:beta-galactosidase